jgi:predicted O-linked N-acetylglucosamine transferase (SPINDLY family)
LNNNLAKNILIEKFKKNNISEERLILEGSSSREDTLEKYNLIDIALDTFPWNGGTTSFELSWMCVPLLTLSGNRFVARCGESINRNLNMNDWIAYNSKDYISKAIKYSNNFNLLNETRSYLRALSRKSVLFDSNAFSKGFIDCLNKIVDFYKKENN